MPLLALQALQQLNSASNIHISVIYEKKKRVIQAVFGFTGKLDIVSKEPQW